MLVRTIADLPEFVAGDETLLREVLLPQRDGLPIGYSLAHARLPPHGRSLPHKLRGSEVYVLLRGAGVMTIEGESRPVRAGEVVYVPAGASQFIENAGDEDLVFLCIVAPAWKPSDEEILPGEP